jgi:hypothetical protein
VEPEAEELADAIEAALPGWVEGCVARILVAWHGRADPEVMARAQDAGRRAAAEVGADVRRLMAMDVDEQRTTPLTLVRQAVRYPTEVLREAGVPGVVRDDFDERHFVEDDYRLTPMTFADIDPALQEPGLVWGAMKARIHLQRRKDVGDS